MSVQNPIPDEVALEYLRAGIVTQALIIVAGLIVVVIFIAWIFNRFLQRQLDISDRNSKTAAKNATSLENLTDAVMSSSSRIELARKDIGTLGERQANANEVLSDLRDLIATFYADATLLDGAVIQAIHAKLRPDINEVKALIATGQGQPPATLPFPEPPASTPATIVRETWDGTRIYEEQDTDPERRWLRANSPKDHHTSTEIVPYAGAQALEMWLRPDAYGQQNGARLFYTSSGRWITLQGVDTLYLRYWLRLPEPIIVDEGDGTKGRFATLGLQIKDDVTFNALVALNARTREGKLEPWLQMAEGVVTPLATYSYPEDGRPVQVDVSVQLRGDRSGKVGVSFGGLPVLSGVGRTISADGKIAGWGLTFYSNALHAPARVLFGGLIASSEPIP